MKHLIVASLFVIFGVVPLMAQKQAPHAKDMIMTSAGEVEIAFIGQSSLMFRFADKVIYIDPQSSVADSSELPKADLILLTHHVDHIDTVALKKIRTDSTIVVLTELCAQIVENGIIMKNGDQDTFFGIEVLAVPAYNLVHTRENGEPYYLKGEGNGYVLTFGDTRVYFAGDTENTLEMKALKDINYAFLPMNAPYTMTPAMVADAITAFKPRVLYPYHYGDTDLSELIKLLKGNVTTQIRLPIVKQRE
jgi:L-ascorbate metabolism protein UlaG (beta-lactamase superfamily)